MRRLGPLLFVLVLLTGCGERPPEPERVIRDDLMGTVMSITAYADRADITAAYDRVAEIHQLCDTNDPDSLVSRINAQAGGEFLPVPADMEVILTLSAQIYESSGGAFDPTTGPLTALWGVGTGKEAKVPAPGAIAALLPLVSFAQVEYQDGQVRLPEPGMALNFGAIAKGYACDAAVAALRERGVESAVLDLGGNVYVLGRKPGGKRWRVGMRSPVVGDSAVIGVLEAEDVSIVTSGPYERWFEEDGKRYHHILHPETGYPVENGLMAVTVLHENSALADALSTACFVLGFEQGHELVAATPGASAIFITDDYSVYRVGKFQFTLEDDRFHWAEFE